MANPYGLSDEDYKWLERTAKYSGKSVEQQWEDSKGSYTPEGQDPAQTYPNKALQAMSLGDEMTLRGYQMNPQAWTIKSGIPDYYSQMAGGARNLDEEKRYSDTVREYINTLRQNQRNMLNDVGQIASGENSIVARQAELEREAMANMLASQTAGSYDPARSRAAAMALGQGMTDLGAKTAVARSQEQREAMAQYAQQAAAMRQQEMGQMGAEASLEEQARQYNLAREQLAQKYIEMGMGEKLAIKAAEQELEKLRLAQSQSDQERAMRAIYGIQEGGTDWGSIISGVGGLASGALKAVAAMSDKRTKVYSGKACKEALEDGNIPLYNMLQKQAEMSTYTGYKVGEPDYTAPKKADAGTMYVPQESAIPSKSIFEPKTQLYAAPGIGERSMIPGEFGYANMDRARMYVPPEDPDYGLARGYGRNPMYNPDTFPPGTAFGISPTAKYMSPEQASSFQPQPGSPSGLLGGSGYRDIKNNLSNAVYSPYRMDEQAKSFQTQPGSPSGYTSGYNLNFDQKNTSSPTANIKLGEKYTFSGKACKEALEDGNIPLYNMLQEASKNVPFLKDETKFYGMLENPEDRLPLDTDNGPLVDTDSGPLVEDMDRENEKQFSPEELAEVARYTDFGPNIPAQLKSLDQDVQQPEEDRLLEGLGAAGQIGKGIGALLGGNKPDTYKYIPPSGNYFTSMVRSPRTGSTGAISQRILSDENSKTPEKEKVFDFLNKLNPVKFKYKKEFLNQAESDGGERTGIFADDAAKSDLGSEMVVENPNGIKMLDMDPKKFNPLVMASLAHLHKRLKKVEDE